MSYEMFMFLFGLIVGAAAVASNPSPYFAAFGLVAVAGLGCGVLTGLGGGFLSLVLFLIYLGGMLVVFAYSAALAAEPYPESWGNLFVLGKMVGYVIGVCVIVGVFGVGWHWDFWYSADEFSDFSMFRGDVGGVALVYSMGGKVLVLGVGVLLLSLFVALALTRGMGRGTLRAV